MARVTKLKLLSFAKLQAFLFLLLGLIAGIIYSVGGAIYDFFTIGLNVGTAMAFMALVGMPAIFAAFGFILGLVEAMLYNLIAKWVGGLNIDLS